MQKSAVVRGSIEEPKQEDKTHLSNDDQGEYSTLESSSITGGDSFYSSPSTVSVSCSELESSPSELKGDSPVDGSCTTQDSDGLRHKIRELETLMLGPISSGTPPEDESWRRLVEMISRGDLKGVLIACARAVSEDDALTTEWLMSELRHMVSVSGEPIQRLGAYMLEGLVARLSSSGSSIYRASRCREPTGGELLSYMSLLFEACPFFKFGYMSANGAIAEAMRDERRIHIIDFQIAQGSQWVSLIQALAARPGGPPQVRITGIDDLISEHARGEGLALVGERLSSVAKGCNLPFEFRAAKLCGEGEVKVQGLTLSPDEALAVNFPFMLHHVPDESVGPENRRDRLLRLVKGFSPKVVTLVEQESNTNTAPFLPRFVEALEYYSAVFESIDAALPRGHRGRIDVEQHCLARDVVNVVACEGAERVERHEVLGKWRSRFSMAGFRPYPLSSLVNATIRALLLNYNRSYGLEEREGALYLGWADRALVVSCAWH